MGAKSACDLPRNRQQVKNLKCSLKNGQSSSNESHSNTDVLAQVMQMCKESSGGETAFVRSVECAPEPMCVLATDQQLVDMERFCTGDVSSVLSVDPTFNLGTFYVTPTTYHNLLVETNGDNNPILLGPILIHQTKTFRPFHYFASTMIRLNPRLIGLKAFGTDGESELIKAFQMCFPNAVHLRCTNHLRQNVKDKLRDLNVSQSVSKEILADIFGTRIGTHFESGLADAQSEALFRKSLDRLKVRWNNLEKSCNSNETEPQFHAWFCRYKAEDIIKCVLPVVRSKAGYKNPTCFFTTNSSESLNHLIKQEVEWKESQLPKLIDSLKAIANDHHSELEKAVINRGEWHFTAQYESLVVSEYSWFSQMSDAAKKQHMKKIFSHKPSSQPVPLTNSESASGATSSQALQSTSTVKLPSIPSVTVEECGITTISESTLRNIWSKAQKLILDGHVVTVPWSSGSKDRMVKSSTSVQPHLVTTNSKDVYYVCDKNCQMFKGFSLCSHTIATAHSNGDLKAFLDKVSGKCMPNLTAIANHGMPSGAGRKGGVAKQKRNRKLPAVETRSVRPCLDTNEAIITGTSTPSSGLEEPQCPLPQQLLSTAFSSPLPSTASKFPLLNASSITLPHSMSSSVLSTPSMTSISVVNDFRPRISTVNAASRGQVVFVGPGTSVNYSCAQSTDLNTKKPFILKFKTNSINICQSCRRNYEGPNDTMGLVVAHAERRLVSNLATGTQFLGRESNSHYHLHMACIRAADSTFTGDRDLVVPDEMKIQLNDFQKVYLISCFKASV